MLPPFLLDEGVPRQIVEMLQRHGYTVLILQDFTLAGSADPVVAIAGDNLGAILLVCDSHFRGVSEIAQSSISNKRLKKLHRIWMRGNQARMCARLEDLLPTIETEFSVYQTRSVKRMFLTIGDSWWRSNR